MVIKTSCWCTSENQDKFLLDVMKVIDTREAEDGDDYWKKLVDRRTVHRKATQVHCKW